MTRIKRVLAYLLSAVMLIALMPANIAVAATTADTANYTFKYVIYSETAEVDHGGTTNGNLRAYVYFRNDSGEKHSENISFSLTDSGDKKEAHGSSEAKEIPPWMVSAIKLKNTSKNAYKCHWLKLYVEVYNGGGVRVGSYQIGSTYYPGGESSDHKTGKWIDSTKEHADDIRYNLSTKRQPTAIDGWDAFGGSEYISPAYSSESDTISVSLPGTLSGDVYNSAFGNVKYNMFDWRDAGKLSFTIDGKAADNTTVDKNTLTKASLFSETTSGKQECVSGFTINKKSLVSYMNKHGINKIDITSTLSFLSQTFSGKKLGWKTTFTKKFTIYRTAFEIADVTYKSDSSSGLLIRDDNNKYFNKNTSKITAVVDVRYDGNDGSVNNAWSHFTGQKLKDVAVAFDAKLQIGKGDNTTNKTPLTITAASKSAKISKYSDFEIEFELPDLPEGIDSEDVGITLILSDATFNFNGNNFYLTSLDDKKNRIDYTTAGTLGSQDIFASSYKVDTVTPDVEFTFDDSVTAVNGWRQTAALKYTANENLYYGSRENTMGYRLRDKNARNYYYALEGGDDARMTVNTAGAAKGMNMSDTVAVAGNGTATKISGKWYRVNGGVEADGVLELYNTIDIAGNYATTVFEDVKLDSLPPRASMTKTESEPASDGSKSVTYSFRVEDATEKSRIYYVFTEGSSPAPTFNPDAVAETTGEIETTIGQWAYLEETVSDTAATPSPSESPGNPVNGAALLKVEKGDSFDGKIYWFTQDGLGNTSSTDDESIKIDNEDTDCVVTVLGDTAHPLKNYDIDIATADGNTVYWRWQNSDGSGAIADYKKYTSASETGSGTQLDSNGNSVTLDGEQTLEIMVQTSLGKTTTHTKTLVFDNSAPTVRFTNKNPGTYRSTQTVAIKAEDSSGIRSAAAKIVNSDGSEIEGCEEYALVAENGTVNEDIEVSGLASGAYAVTVSATDNNGFETTETSNPFYIRNAAPTMSVSAESDTVFNESPLTAQNEYKLNVSVAESFKDASGSQILYWRAADSSSEYSAWTSAGEMTTDDNGFALDFTVDTPVKLTEGENNISIQTIIAPDDVNPSNLENLDVDTIATDSVTVYYDATKPQYRLRLSDAHTTETISGTLELSDNLSDDITLDLNGLGDTTLTAEAEEDDANSYTITVSENVNSVIYAVDTAGNKAEIPILITGIDKSAPAVSHTEPTTDTVGARTFAYMNVTVTDVADEDVRFALIPESDLSTAIDSDGNIKDAYFTDIAGEDDADDTVQTPLTGLPNDYTAFTADVEDKTAADYDDEYDITYLVTLKGLSGKYYIGVRAEDSLGNTQDTLFTDAALEPKDTETAIVGYSVSPKQAYNRARVDVEFNVPVYVLPQDKITDTAADDMTVEETNLDNAEKYSTDHALNRSFIITKTGTYAVYTADELGRTKRFDITVTDSDVTFDDTLDITAQTVVLTGTYDYSTNVLTETSREVMDGDKYAAPAGGGANSDGTENYTVIEVTAPDGYTVFPNTIFSTDGDTEWDDEEGTRFWAAQSEQYLTSTGGYSKLVYETSWLYDDNGDAIEKYERAINLYLIDAADSSEVPVTVYAGNIDNTRPQGTVTLTPDTKRDEEGTPLVFTPGNVTADITFSDSQSGVTYLEVYDLDDGESTNYSLDIPFTDSNGDPIDYSTTPYTFSNDYIDLTVYGTADLKDIKTAEIVFKENTTACVIVGNGAGEVASPTADGDSALIVDYINKSDIAESDYTVSYYYQDNTGAWNPITDGIYYRTAKAVVEPTESGTERGIYVSNNNKKNERLLDSFDSNFTFEISDKYGYKTEVTAKLSNFDENPGTISYSLATAGKTNKPVDITITVSDDESGVGSVTLSRGSEDIPLTDEGEGVFTGEVSNVGNHTITLTDKAGNVAQKVFIVSNIDATLPTISKVDYSDTTRTSKTVSAELSYSKPGVTLTKVESVSGLDASDYTVDYLNSIIRFSENGSVNVWFTDEYGNVGTDVVTVGNIYKTPPALEAVMTVADNKSSVDVSFEKAVTSTGAYVDTKRELSEIMVDYNGIVKSAEDENGEKATYTFTDNGTYTFKVYDDEGVASYLTIEITDIDKSAPKITQIRWSYDYDVLENGEWVTKTAEATRDVRDEYGYRIATDVNPVTNNDVNVTVVTDSETTILDNEDSELSTEHKIIYPENGMYIFNMQKGNGLTDSYGFDVGVIDKTPPVIDLTTQELVIYENAAANATAYSKDLITKPGTAFEAYDMFGGKTDLSDRVTIDLGDFNADDITQNTFDRNSPYTVTYMVTDDAHNTTSVQMTVRLVGYFDTVALVNGTYPDYAGRSQVTGDSVNISLHNFSGVSYAKVEKGVKTLGQMKKTGTVLERTSTESSSYTYSFTPTEKGWYTVLVQTDKRDYFNLQIYVDR